MSKNFLVLNLPNEGDDLILEIVYDNFESKFKVASIQLSL